MCVPSASRARAPRALDPRGDAGTRRSALHRAFSTPFPAHHPRTRRRARRDARVDAHHASHIDRSFVRSARPFVRSFVRSIDRIESIRIDSTRLDSTRDARRPRSSLSRARAVVRVRSRPRVARHRRRDTRPSSRRRRPSHSLSTRAERFDAFIRAHLSACSASFALYTRSSRAYALRSSSTPSLARIVAFARATRTTSAARSIAIERADRDEGTARGRRTPFDGFEMVQCMYRVSGYYEFVGVLLLLIDFTGISVCTECLDTTNMSVCTRPIPRGDRDACGRDSSRVVIARWIVSHR